VRALASPVRRRFTGNGDAPPRPPHLPVVSSVPLLPVGPARPAPPRRRPRRRREHAGTKRPADVEAGQGHICEKKVFSKDPSAKRPRPPPLVVLLFHVFMLLPYKIPRKPQKNPKIVKLVLLETRFQTLQLLLMKFSSNTFASILNLKLKGILYITSTF
jgi:hypothetical protein